MELKVFNQKFRNLPIPGDFRFCDFWGAFFRSSAFSCSHTCSRGTLFPFELFNIFIIIFLYPPNTHPEIFHFIPVPVKLIITIIIIAIIIIIFIITLLLLLSSFLLILVSAILFILFSLILFSIVNIIIIFFSVLCLTCMHPLYLFIVFVSNLHHFIFPLLIQASFLSLSFIHLYHHHHHHFNFVLINSTSDWRRIQQMKSSHMIYPYPLIILGKP